MSFLKNYQNVYLLKRFIEHKINLVPGSTPTFRNHHRLSPQDLDELKFI